MIWSVNVNRINVLKSSKTDICAKLQRNDLDEFGDMLVSFGLPKNCPVPQVIQQLNISIFFDSST